MRQTAGPMFGRLSLLPPLSPMTVAAHRYKILANMFKRAIRNPRSTTQAALAFAGALAATIAVAQQPQTVRLRGVIEKVDGHTVLAKLTKGDEIKLNLADNVLVVGVVKASPSRS